MHSLAMFFSWFSLPPAASVIAVSATVFAVMQAAKRSPWLARYMQGWVAVLVNVLLTISGILSTTLPGQLWTQQTLQLVLIAVLMSAGIHGTYSKVIEKEPPGPKKLN